MPPPLRLQALDLPVGELAPVERFCRWALGMTPAHEAAEGAAGAVLLGWGREDRVRLIDAPATRAAGHPEPEEAVVLRLPAADVEKAAAWLAERGLTPASVRVPPEDAGAARQAWAGAHVETVEEEAARNRLTVSLRGPSGRVDLFFPLPHEVVVDRGSIGPFPWASGARRGLEIPGLLGVTTGTPDPSAARAFLVGLGLSELEPGGPFTAGDHQWVLEERDPPGIYGYAVAVPAARVKDLARTMGHLGADYRLDGHRLVGVDPAGRIAMVHGVHAA